MLVIGCKPTILCTGPNDEIEIDGVPVVRTVPPTHESQLAKRKIAKADFLIEDIIGPDGWETGIENLGRFIDWQLSQINADVLHLNSFTSAFSINEIDCPVVVTNHENGQESDNLWGEGFFDWFANANKLHPNKLGRHKLLAVPTNYYADLYSDLFQQKIVGMMQGIRLENFQAIYNQRTIQDQLTILLPSRFEPAQKGHDLAIKAVASLREKGFDIKLIISGIRDDYVKRLEEFRDDLGKRSDFSFIEFRRYGDMQLAYTAADIVLSPERYCSYGLSISEALACGCQTVLSDIPTYLEIASQYENAHFFRCGDVDDLERALLKLIDANAKKSVPSIEFRAVNDMRECAKAYAASYLRCLNPGREPRISRFGEIGG